MPRCCAVSVLFPSRAQLKRSIQRAEADGRREEEYHTENCRNPPQSTKDDPEYQAPDSEDGSNDTIRASHILDHAGLLIVNE